MLFRLVSAALVLVVLLAGCDSGRTNTALDDLDGRYTLSALTFDPVSPAVTDADVAARYDLRDTSLEIFGANGRVLFRTRQNGTQNSGLILLNATATRGSATFRADSENEAFLRPLLLPSTFTLQFDPGSPRTLTAAISLSRVDLRAFDPVAYQGLDPIDGTLRVQFDRVAN